MNDIEKQKGVSLIMTFFIMMIILSVVLSISILLYSEIKVIRNMGSSVVSFYLADSGIEKVLYYDRQVLPNVSNVVRGMCTMYLEDDNPEFCTTDPTPLNTNTEHSIYCQPVSGFEDPVPGDDNPTQGCDPEVCNSCKISFKTTFQTSSGDKEYITVAEVYHDETYPGDPSKTDFEISSKGIFKNAQRQIYIKIYPGE